MTCNAIPSDYYDLPPRCQLHDGHTGDHVGGDGQVGMVRVESGDTWAEVNEVTADVEQAAAGWRRLLRRVA